jgi:probable HAF family extracellular repeat protein
MLKRMSYILTALCGVGLLGLAILPPAVYAADKAQAAGKPPPPPPGPAYTLTQLSALPGFTNVDAKDVNDSGQVVGCMWTVNGPRHAVVWETALAAATDLDNGNGSEAWGINNLGQVVGRCQFEVGGMARPAVWIPDGLGGYTPTDLMGDADLYGCANDINDSGFVVGYFELDGVEMGFVICPEDTDLDGAPDIWFRDVDQNGVNDLMFVLEPHANADGVEPYALNDWGWVVGEDYTLSGYDAFLIIPDDTLPNPWFADENGDGINDLMIHLGASHANDVNNVGRIVGSDDWSWDARLWTVVVAPNGSVTVTTTALPKPSGTRNGPSKAINDNGQVVGTTNTRKDLDNHPLLWQQANGSMLLESLTSNKAGFSDLDTASAINEGGQIVGEGTTSAGERAYLATPVR